MKKNIYLSLDSWYPQVDGVYITVNNYYKHLTASGNECKVIAPSYGKKFDAEAISNSGIPAMHCKSLKVPVGGFYDALPKMDSSLKKLFKQTRPDILHSHSPFNIGKFFAEQGKKTNTPSILTFHTKFKEEFLRFTKSKVLTEMLLNRIMGVINRFDYVWTVCNGTVDVLREYGYKGKVMVMRNGTDMTRSDEALKLVDDINKQYGLSDSENVLLFVGRVVSVKNLQFIFKTLKNINEKSSKVFKLLVVGGGDIDEHKRMTEDLGVDKNVIFTDIVMDRERLKAFYERADLFVFPSTFDAMSLCPLEAAAFELPSLLIKGSSTAETVTDNVSGFCEVEDAEAWANRIIELFDDKTVLHKAGAIARKEVYRSWEDAVAEAESHYDAILNGKE